MWSYQNPVRIVFGEGALGELAALLKGRSYVLVTYPDAAFTVLQRKVHDLVGPPLLVIDDVAPNPDFELLADQSARLSELASQPEAIVALGGGSVIDTAKVMAAAQGNFAWVADFLKDKDIGGHFQATPIIALPTTAGTGSEVTCWGTVWNEAAGVKYSLALPDLYPEAAIVDPALMLGKPRALTISTGLDAFSHALESLWNKNANPVSATFAVSAAREILEVLPRLVVDLENFELRSRMARAALFAGLAFSNTKTAIAHSISYPITLRHDVPHGIACSFTLPLIMRSIEACDGICAESLKAIFEAPVREGADLLDAFLRRLQVSTNLSDYGLSREEFVALAAEAFDGERGQNFIGSRQALEAELSGSARREALPVQ